jgi:cytosine/adenosine deaminase-related metal-dependent hydrolase
MTMRYAYLTRDEVNQALALAFAAEHGIDLDVHARHDAIEGRQYDGVLFDLDSLTDGQRDDDLAWLLAGVSSHPVAVHSYNLEEDSIKALRKQGVAVYPRLEERVFQKLRRSVARRGYRRVGTL